VFAGRDPLLVGREHASVQRPQVILGDVGDAYAQGLQGSPPVVVNPWRVVATLRDALAPGAERPGKLWFLVGTAKKP
jgi:hypothetical protein